MSTRPRKRRPEAPTVLQRYGLLIVPNFSLIALGAVADPLRLANGVLERKVYEWVVIGTDAAPVPSSDGIRVVPDRTIADGDRFDAVFVIGPNPIPRRGYGEISTWLRKQAARGSALGGIDTGSAYLARAGLLDGYRCTIHWEDRDVLLEQFPHLIVSNRLFEIDRDRYTCSGGVSPLDLMTFLLSQPPGGRELAEQVTGLLVAQRRAADENQTVPLRQRLAAVPKLLVDALELMESNLEEPLTPVEIASYLALSRRTLERLFQSHLGMSPAQKYLQLRLARARIAMLRTHRSLDDVAVANGFASTSHFVARYRKAFGRTPMADRAGLGNAGPASPTAT
jgi:transcriptional regulator GlxA family with amidase domain